MSVAAHLRQRLQWPRRVVVAIDVAALLLSVCAVVAAFKAMEAETDAPFIVAQVLLTTAIPLDVLALVLSMTRIERRSVDLTMIPVGFVVLVVTLLVGWALCWAAGLGGERCWWEVLDP